MDDSSGTQRTARGDQPGVAWGWSLAALLVVAFAAMAIEFPLALRADRAGWWASVQALLTGDEYTFGVGSARGMYPIYRRLLAAMTSHTMLGGVALGLGVLQFVPGLRRRRRKLHRASGAVVVVAVACSMVGAFSYLAATPLVEIYASPAFGLALWSLAIMCVVALSLAVLAIRRRDFRSHMGFMALMMATLLTAPVLRVAWVLFGLSAATNMTTVNQGVSTFLIPCTVLIMALWMHRVGAADLPAREREGIMPSSALSVCAWATLVVVAHETLLAAAGFDLLSVSRGPHERLPMVAALWGVPTMLLAWRAPTDIAIALSGERVPFRSKTLVALSAAGAFAIAAAHPRHAVDAHAMVYFWVALGVTQIALVAASHASARADEPWTLLWSHLTLSASQWPLLWVIAIACGQNFTVAAWFACTAGAVITVTVAFLTAFSIRLPFAVDGP